MKSDSARHNFNSQVDGWVARAVNSGTTSFDELLTRLPGVYPSNALASVRRLRKSNRVRPGFASRIERQARSRPPLQTPLRGALLPPHPLDFEWRFSRSTGKELLARAGDLCAGNDVVLLLGTPTLATTIAKAPHRPRYVYVGEDNAITRQIASIQSRLSGPLEVRPCGPGALQPEEANVVILDPPWYPDFLRSMLRAAACACRPGGHILVSLPPIGTNSHIANDRARTLQLVAKLSLTVVSIEPGILSYDTPYFEANALAAEGITNIPKYWRRGDLFVFEKAQHSLSLELTHAVCKRQWDEAVIGRMRVFISTKAVRKPGPDPDLRSIIPGDVLPTVRRGDPRRQLAQVWTSGNRIFASDRPGVVLLAARHAESGGDYDGMNGLSESDRDAILRLSYSLGELAVIEQAEERSGRFEEAECPIKGFKSKSASSQVLSRTAHFGAATSAK